MGAFADAVSGLASNVGLSSPDASDLERDLPLSMAPLTDDEVASVCAPIVFSSLLLSSLELIDTKVYEP